MKANISRIVVMVGFAAAIGTVQADEVAAEQRKPIEIRYASWNIGHFALGKSAKSTIGPERADEMSKLYKAFLEEVGADYIGVCEYSKDFTTDCSAKAEDAAFGRYSESVVGPQHNYQWNAAFWNGFKKLNKRVKEYEKHIQNVYYLATRLDVGGVEVVFVQTHLDWSTFMDGHEHDREEQMRELIADFKDEPRVVISGDFNVGIRPKDRSVRSQDNPAEYKVFEAAGYTLGNDGSFKTAPSGNCRMSLDNIIVKGVELKDFKVYDRPDLSDHALVSATLIVK